VSVFGALFSHALLERLAQAFPADTPAPTSLSPEQVHALAAPLQQAYLAAFSGAMHGVFLVACLVTCLAFALSWLLREVPLRKAVA
jgi:hypothetical protein